MSKIRIPYSRQLIEKDDIEAVIGVLESDFLTQGPKVQEFEEAIAEFCGARYAVSFSNGTAALHAACFAAGVKAGDEGIVPAISFAATANCLAYVGAKPVFSDVTPGIPLLDLEYAEKKRNARTKAVIPVDFAGAAADMPAIYKWAKEHDLAVIEDACHALGGRYQNPKKSSEWVRIGSCEHSDMTVFSFHPVKNITTGEGGMVTTNDEKLAQKLRTFRQHGIVRPEASSGQPAWYYEMQLLGFNFRLTDMQAALGVSQLKKISRYMKIRQELFDRYAELLTGMDEWKLLQPSKKTESALHLALLQIEPPFERDELFQFFQSNNIGVQVHYQPIYRHPYYMKHSPVDLKRYPVSEKYFAKTLSLPLYPSMTKSDQDRVLETLHRWRESCQTPRRASL